MAKRASSRAKTPAIPDLTESYATWSYAGPSILTPDALDTLVEAVRRLGAYRMFGRVMCPSNGIAIEVAGRVRQRTGMLSPDETTLTVIGAKPRFSVRAMDLAFASTVTDASYSIGRIACR